MRKLLVVLVAVLLYSCGEVNRKQTPPKYKQGDVVYLKPDSTKAVISYVWVDNNSYSVDYYDAEHEPQSMHVPEYGVYGKAE